MYRCVQNFRKSFVFSIKSLDTIDFRVSSFFRKLYDNNMALLVKKKILSRISITKKVIKFTPKYEENINVKVRLKNRLVHEVFHFHCQLRDIIESKSRMVIDMEGYCPNTNDCSKSLKKKKSHLITDNKMTKASYTPHSSNAR